MEPSIAQQLKQIRESQEISLEEIAQKTRIPLTYLTAIETGDEESIPSKVQLRGFLRLYANELGVDLEDLRVGDYHLSKNELPKVPVEQADNVEKAQTPSSEAQRVEPAAIPEPEQEIEPEAEAESPADIDPTPSQSDDFEPGATTDTSKQKSSTEIFKEIGSRLKHRREMLSLSIKNIHENTHIQEQHLRSLESGAFDQLPSPIHAKGMLDNYADFLSLDTDAILLNYSEALQLQRTEKQSEVQKRDRRSARELSPAALRLKNFFTLDLLVISALFITFAIFVIWGVNRILDTEMPDLQETDIPGVSDVLLAAETPTPPIADDSEIIEIDEEQIEEETEVDEDEDPLFGVELGTSPINIILLPRQRLWVEVTADGNMVYQGRLMPGNAYDFSAQEQLDLLTGNIGSLQIIFNNEDLGSLGAIGEVANLSFTETGLDLPVAPTPTITETPQTTPTPSPTP